MAKPRSEAQAFRLERLRRTGADYAPASDKTMRALARAGLVQRVAGPTPHWRVKPGRADPDFKPLTPPTKTQLQTLRRFRAGSAEPAGRSGANPTMNALRRHGLVERVRTAAGWRWRLTPKGQNHA